MKKITAILLCAFLILCAVGCKKEEDQEKPIQGNTQIPNPFTQCQSLDEAFEKAGFEFSAPSGIKTGTNQIIRASDTMIELIYLDSGENEIARVRKVRAQENEDVTGDTNEYAKVEDVKILTHSVTIKGENELIMLASWHEGDYGYVIYSTEGLALEELTGLIEVMS